MPATASRLPPQTLSLLDDCPRSPPSYTPKHPSLPSPKPAHPPPPQLTPSPRTEKKPPLSPPPEVEGRKFDKADRRPDLPSDPRAEPPSDSRAPSAPAPKEGGNENKEKETTKADAQGAAAREPIDVEVFQQILDLDEDDSYEFSRSMVDDFYIQAEETFGTMDTLLEDKDLLALSDKGHFLKGSSAAIGIQNVQRSCEEIQNYGKLQGEGEKPITTEDALERLGIVLMRVRVEYEEAKNWLNQWFDDPKFRREHGFA